MINRPPALNQPITETAQLPRAIGLFPLEGVVLPPKGLLPLNIFEPRYLALVEDALRGERLIGMIQPNAGESAPDGAPALYACGGLGRITQFSETGDGRYQIVLTGLCRFHLRRELPTTALYRIGEVDYEPYAQDLARPADDSRLDRDALVAFIAARAAASGDGRPIARDFKDAPRVALLDAIIMASGLPARDLQALLEESDALARANLWSAIMEREHGAPVGRILQ
jgi:hypothetical protein